MVEIVAYGMGTDSTALLIEKIRRGEPAPHAILAADTGGERSRTYAYRDMFSAWLVERGYPAIVTVRKKDGVTLEEDSVARRALPAIAYGFKTCSERWKARPQNIWANNDPVCKAAWQRGEKVTKLIGYEYGEEHRMKSPDDKYVNRYPLIEWEMDRADCVATITGAGLPLPGKSACFFCPSNTKPEILQLANEEPALLSRALAMEANAELTKIKGLGRRFSWAAFLAGEWTPDITPERPCECMD